MENEIIINSVEVSPIYQVLVRGVKETEFVRVSINLTNTSERHSYFVFEGLRTFEYDSSSKTLNLFFNDTPQNVIHSKQHHSVNEFIAKQVEIAPKASKIIEVVIPRLIQKMEPPLPNQLGLRIKETDISGLVKIKCNFAYDSVPLNINKTATHKVLRDSLTDWGKTIEKTFSAKIITKK